MLDSLGLRLIGLNKERGLDEVPITNTPYLPALAAVWVCVCVCVCVCGGGGGGGVGGGKIIEGWGGSGIDVPRQQAGLASVWLRV